MRLESRRLCAVVLGPSPFRRGRIRPSLAALLALGGILAFGPAAMAQRRLFFDFDTNADGQTNLTDPVFILNFLFQAGPPPPCAEAANPNDDDGTNLSDSVYLLNFLFQGGAPPTAPGPPPMACGPDPDNSPNDLGCETYESC